MAVRPTIGASDRLSFTLFMAIAIHALLIFGVSFDLAINQNDSKILDVTLVQHQSEEAENPDFLAQFSQAGSGTEDEAKLLTTTETSEFEDNSIQEIEQNQQERLIEHRDDEQLKLITTKSDTDPLMLAVEIFDIALQGNANITQDSLQQTFDIATLKAKLADKRQRYAARPRVRTLTALSTKASSEAAYIVGWLTKVERVGNLNYPTIARQNHLTGDVRLLVSITQSGAVKRVEVMESSGHSILDDAAKRIALLASPYEPFSPDMREQFDELEIIRTWKFVSELNLEF